MFQALRSTKATFSGSSGSILPKRLAVDVNGPSTLPPTHMVAIYSSCPSGPEPRCVMMYPVHQSILSLYSANLSVLPTSRLCQQILRPLTRFPLCQLPCQIQFPFLTQFLSLKDVQPLFDASLSHPASGLPYDLHQPERYGAFVSKYSLILAQNYTMQRLASPTLMQWR